MSNVAWLHLDKSHKGNTILCSKNPILRKLTIDEIQKSNSHQTFGKYDSIRTMLNASHNNGVQNCAVLLIDWVVFSSTEIFLRSMMLNVTWIKWYKNIWRDDVRSFQWKINQRFPTQTYAMERKFFAYLRNQRTNIAISYAPHMRHTPNAIQYFHSVYFM